jgi:hypothetical protein
MKNKWWIVENVLFIILASLIPLGIRPKLGVVTGVLVSMGLFLALQLISIILKFVLSFIVGNLIRYVIFFANYKSYKGEGIINFGCRDLTSLNPAAAKYAKIFMEAIIWIMCIIAILIAAGIIKF